MAVGPGVEVRGWRLRNESARPVRVGCFRRRLDGDYHGPYHQQISDILLAPQGVWMTGNDMPAVAGPLDWVVTQGEPAGVSVLVVTDTGTVAGAGVPEQAHAVEASAARARALLDDTLGPERSALLRAGRLPILSRDRPGLAYLIDPAAAGVHVFVDTQAHPDLPRECRGWAPDPGDCLPGRAAFQALAWLCVHPAGYLDRTLPMDDQLLALYLACTAGEAEMWRQANPGPAQRRNDRAARRGELHPALG